MLGGVIGGRAQQAQAVDMDLHQLGLETLQRLEAADELTEAVGRLPELGQAEHPARRDDRVGADVPALNSAAVFSVSARA